MPIQEFWCDQREYLDLQRCGGSLGHLNRTLGSKLIAILEDIGSMNFCIYL